MEIFTRLLIGFAIFFTGVTLNVSIMRKKEGKAKGIMPALSFVVICAGLTVLVWMASVINITV